MRISDWSQTCALPICPHRATAGCTAGKDDRRIPVMTENTPPVEAAADTTAPMRLRAEPPRVTRLSRKMLAGVGAVALLGIGGALIYALQTRDMSGSSKELYSPENRPTADGLDRKSTRLKSSH